MRQDADCESDRNPVIATVRIKLKSVQTNEVTAKWNLTKQEGEAYTCKCEFHRKCEAQLGMIRKRRLGKILEVFGKA